MNIKSVVVGGPIGRDIEECRCFGPEEKEGMMGLKPMFVPQGEEGIKPPH